MAKNPIPSIDLEHESQFFPPMNTHSIGWMRISTQKTNIVYIDFGDGSPIYSQSFSGLLSIPVNSLHEYETIERRMTRIWFEYPQLVTQFSLSWAAFIGNFPLNLGLYNLKQLGIIQTLFNTFPIDFLGGDFRRLNLNRVTNMTITYIPEWITKSRIQDLSIHGGIELDNDATDSIENLMDIQDLETLSLADTKITDIPSNFKDKDTLRRLFLGNNPFTEITQNVNDCKQLTEISFGYHGDYWTAQGSNLFTSWGIGVSDMPNLTTLRWAYCTHISDVAPTGLETATNLKTLDGRNCYDTELRINNFIDSIYSLVTMYASMSTGNTLLRQVNLNVGYITFVDLTTRPSGLYQAPSGYSQGVSNGTPESQMEKIYVLVNQYDWTITVKNEAGTNNQVYAP